MATRGFRISSLVILHAVNLLTEAESCSFPTNLHGEWRIDNSNVYKVNEETFQKVGNNGQVIVTYVCGSLFLSTNSARVFDYLLLVEQQNANNKLCVQSKVDGKNILIFAKAHEAIGDDETDVTAENSCQGKEYLTPFQIFIKTSEREDCPYLQHASGKYRARVKTDDDLATVCENDETSLANVINSSIHLDTCVTGVPGLPLKGSVLSCAGVISQQPNIGANSISAKILIVRHHNRYYCARILTPTIVGVFLPEIWLSVDIMNYSQGMVRCQLYHAERSSKTNRYVSIRLTPYDCASGVCGNGGVCMQQFGSYTCVCTDGFIGEHCETDVCASSPCQNRGTCVRTAQGYSCSCGDGFFGQHCENATCLSSCQNGGTCFLVDGGFNCDCSDGYTGETCELNSTTTCLSSPCQNGGTCFLVDGGFNCSCTDDYSGETCEIAADGLDEQQEQSNATDNSLQWYWIIVIILSVLAVILLIVILVCLATCNTDEEKRERYEQEIIFDSEVKEETPKTMAEPYMEKSAKTGATKKSGLSAATAVTSGSKATAASNISPASANLLSADYSAPSDTSSDAASLATDYSGRASGATGKSADRPSVNKRHTSKRLHSRKSRSSSRRTSAVDNDADADDAVSQGTENGAYYSLLSEARLLSEIL